MLTIVLALLLANDFDPDAPSLGIAVITLDDFKKVLKDYKKLNFPSTIKHGVAVTQIDEYGSFSKSSIAKMDVITAIDKKDVTTVEELYAIFSALKPGERHEFTGFHPDESGDKVIWTPETWTVSIVSKREVRFEQFDTAKDGVTDVTIMRHKGSTKYINEKSELVPLISVSKDNTRQIYFRIQYVVPTRDTLHIRDFTVKADDEKWEIKPKPSEMRIEPDSPTTAEWYTVTQNAEKMLRAIAKSSKATIRHQGAQSFKDRDLTKDEIVRVKMAIEVYDMLAKKK